MPICPAQRRPFETFQSADVAYLFPGRRCGRSEASSKSMSRETGQF